MLEHLYIKNVALIQSCEINFSEGLNILSGETGAGKSMIIDSLNFSLGERVSKDFIRKDESMATVEALFNIKDNLFHEKLLNQGIGIDDDNSLLITRTLNQSGKTVCRVNGSVVTLGMLREISESVIDIHGQHEHQSLLNPSKHIWLLDQFCGEELEKIKIKFEDIYKKVKKIQKDLEILIGDIGEREKRIDFLRFQVEEIGTANLKPLEEEELVESRKILANGEKLISLTKKSLTLLYDGEDEEISAFDKLAQALSYLRDVKTIDTKMDYVVESIDSIYAQLDDAIRELRQYESSIERDPERLEEIEERLQLIYKLKRKYGTNITEILAHYDVAERELTFLSSNEEAVQELEKEYSINLKELELMAFDMTKIRKERANDIEKEIESELQELEMKNARFKILIDNKEQITSNGFDKVEFLISANRGEELKPLAKIASGGEMSRVMLALKTVLAKADNIETFVFDEIDTGVSGRTAQKVGEKMAQLGNTHQIICITHLPQIAALADSHFLIEKNVVGEKTLTDVLSLDKESMIAEIARLIGGAKITEATLIAAKELNEQGSIWKESL